MASKGSPLGRDGGNDLLDRSKVRILLCDNDVKSSQEVLRLLYKCSYQGWWYSWLIILLAHFLSYYFQLLIYFLWFPLQMLVFFDHETRDFTFIISLTCVTLEFRRLSCAIAIYLYSSNGLIGAKQTNYCVKIVFFILHLLKKVFISIFSWESLC